jgi:hypothetical protein
VLRGVGAGVTYHGSLRRVGEVLAALAAEPLTRFRAGAARRAGKLEPRAAMDAELYPRDCRPQEAQSICSLLGDQPLVKGDSLTDPLAQAARGSTRQRTQEAAHLLPEAGFDERPLRTVPRTTSLRPQEASVGDVLVRHALQAIADDGEIEKTLEAIRG